MKMTKSILVLFLAIMLAFSLFSCGGKTPPCETHVDEDGDKLCDVCGEAVEDNTPESTEVKLIENGTPTFQIVFDKELPTTVRLELNNLAKALKKATGTEVAIKLDNADGKADCEILVGSIASRGEQFDFDYRELGPKGKAIKIIEGKVILLAGSEDSFIDLIESFAEDVLKLDGEELTEENVTATLDDCFYEPQTEYRIDSISVGDVVMDKHSIIINTANQAAVAAAQNIQNNFYTFAGYWLPIVDEAEASSTENAIVLKVLPKDGVSDGYKLYVSGSSIIFEIMYDNKLEAKVNDFLAPIKLKTGDVKLTASMVNKTENIRVITYADFFKEKGETIDTTGTTDVSKQIKEVHAYANQYGHDVKAGKGDYLIGAGNGSSSIVIKTNTDWTGATFIVDDRKLEAGSAAAGASIINVASDYRSSGYSSSSEILVKANEAIKNGDIDFHSLKTFFDFSTGYKCMIAPTNANHKVYIRYGGNANQGSAQCEVVLIDEEGNIDPDTPFLLDYTEITGMTVYRVDDAPITLTGGTFITRANAAPCSYSAGFTRNINVSRSNVTIKGLVHKITDEGDVGSCYSGFITARYLNNMLLEDCVVQGHRAYVDESVQPDGTIKYGTTMGTYELGGYMANNLYYKNCTQSNFYDKNGNATSTWYDENGQTGPRNDNPMAKAGLWGVMGTNYCKNITYDQCTLSRLDAHAGVYNASIINNSNVITVSLIGGGTALIEDSVIHNTSFITLRNDYGSTWKGEVIIRNSTLKTSTQTPYVFVGQWYHHYFGYTCYLPSLLLDNVSVTSGAPLTLFDDFTGTSTIYELMPDDFKYYEISESTDISADKVMINGQEYDNVNKTMLPDYIKIMNCDDVKIIGSVDKVLNAQIEEIIKNSKTEE